VEHHRCGGQLGAGFEEKGLSKRAAKPNENHQDELLQKEVEDGLPAPDSGVMRDGGCDDLAAGGVAVWQPDRGDLPGLSGCAAGIRCGS
jgi:hypothetical protein